MNANRKTRVAWATLLGVSAFAGACYYYKKHHKAAPSVEEDNLLSDKLPEELCLSAETPGVFFGTVPGYPEQYVGKPLHTDGHVLVAGSSGSGKTTSIVYPTMETAAGFGIYLDVKGDLAEHWHQVNGESGKKCFVLNPYDPAQSNCWYDPFSPMKDDPEHLADHAYQLAKMLIPSPSLAHDKIWYPDGVETDTYAAGLMQGYVDNKHIKYRLKQISEKEWTPSDIPDYDQISRFVQSEVVYAYNADITHGVDADGTCDPTGYLTRAQLAQLLYNIGITQESSVKFVSYLSGFGG